MRCAASTNHFHFTVSPPSMAMGVNRVAAAGPHGVDPPRHRAAAGDHSRRSSNYERHKVSRAGGSRDGFDDDGFLSPSVRTMQSCLNGWMATGHLSSPRADPMVVAKLKEQYEE